MAEEGPRAAGGGAGRSNRVVTGLAVLGFYLLLLVFAEGALRTLFWLSDRGGRAAPADAPRDESRARLPAYGGADYDPVETWRELWQATDEWLAYQPYTVWSRRDHGRLVSVDEEGHRRTLPRPEDPAVPELWTFGGSTTWGMGVPDAHTMPSQLAAEFARWGVDVRVRNLGKTGFVSTQEVLLLIRELQRGRRPTWVVVYDGANEGIGSAEAPAQTNPHYLQNRIASLFEGSAGVTESPLRRILEGSGINRLAGALRRRLGLGGGAASGPSGRQDWRTQPPDGARGADWLLANYGFVEDLAAAYDFEAWLFFQPRLGIGEKPLHPSEVELLDEVRADPEHAWILDFTEQLQAGVRRRIAEGSAPARLVDISDLYADVDEAVYIDWVHVTHRGNRRIAARIFETLRPALCRGRDGVEPARARRQLERACRAGEAD